MDFRPWLRVQFSSAQLNEASQTLCQARHLIETHGWTTDWYRMQAGWLDLSGAVNKAVGISTIPSFDNPAVIAEAILTRWLGMNIYTWNDEHACNRTHVINILDGVIAVLTKEIQHGPADTDQEDEKERGKSSDHVGAH